MSPHRVILAMGVTLVVLGASREGLARTVLVTAQLDYAAAPGCPSVDRFKEVVAAHLGYDPFQGDARERVVVQIESGGRTLEGRLEWRNVDRGSIGEQSFPSRTGDCTELVRAMGFALAVQIQLMATTERPSPAAPAPLPPPPPAAVPSPAVPLAKAAAAAPAASVPLRGPAVLVGAGISAGLGLSPNVAALGRLSVTAAWSHAAVELAGELSTPTATSRWDGGGFSQEELFASLAACGMLSRLSACAVGKIGELRVVGQGVDVALRTSGLELQAGLRLAASHSVGSRASIMARAEGLGRLARGIVTLDSMPVWITPRFAALFGIDIVFRFQPRRRRSRGRRYLPAWTRSWWWP